MRKIGRKIRRGRLWVWMEEEAGVRGWKVRGSQVLTVAKTAVLRTTEWEKVKVGAGGGGRREEKEEAGLSRPGQDP